MASLPDDQIKALVAVAVEARANSYAPYSGFATGAAVLTDTGSIHRGSIVENLVFGLAMCAERAALFTAISAGSGRPIALALAAPRTAGQRTFPCGPCLQVAVEFGGLSMTVVSVDPDDGNHETTTIADLAPGLPHRRNPGAGLL